MKSIKSSITKVVYLGLVLGSGLVTAANLENGDKIVESNCQGCHKIGLLNSPKIGDTAEWKKRAEQGFSVLVEHALNGFNSMPAKGGLMSLTTTDIEDAVASLLKSANVEIKAAPKKQPKKKTAAKPKPVEKKAEEKKTVKAEVATPQPKAPEKLKKQIAASKKANQFNRLMQPKSEWNQPPAEDGIHDEDNEGTYMLQSPKEAFTDLNRSKSGNRVNWVKSLNEGNISPRFDLNDPDKVPFVMDMDIVREVKGSMPDVVYPHKEHTQWLDCSNCHPRIFIPKKGANQISMASIIMGEKCGVCHGKVAFPVSECRLCHSKKKERIQRKK